MNECVCFFECACVRVYVHVRVENEARKMKCSPILHVRTCGCMGVHQCRNELVVVHACMSTRVSSRTHSLCSKGTTKEAKDTRVIKDKASARMHSTGEDLGA